MYGVYGVVYGVVHCVKHAYIVHITVKQPYLYVHCILRQYTTTHTLSHTTTTLTKQAQGARPDLFLLAQSVIDRLARALGSMSEHWDAVLSPTAGAVGWRLGIPQHGIDTFSEEVIRGTAFAPLSQLLSLVDPALRQQSGRGNWMVVSPAAGTASGWLRIVDDLASIQHDTFERPTVLLCNHVGGEEEVPGGCTALLTPDSIDVLCHSAVRARNCRVFLATCYQREELQDMHRYDGQFVQVGGYVWGVGGGEGGVGDRELGCLVIEYDV